MLNRGLWVASGAMLTAAVVLADPLTAMVQEGLPSAPLNLTASVDGSTLGLNWQPPTSGTVERYVIEWYGGTSGPWVPVLSVRSNSLIVPNFFRPGLSVRFRVYAVNTAGAGPPSNPTSFIHPTVCTGPPTAPQGVSGNVVGSRVTLTWSSPLGGCAPTRYVVFAGSGPGLSNVAQVTITETSLSASAPLGTYYVRVVASNAYGASAASNEVSLTVQDTCSIPGPPILLPPAASGTTVALNWQPSGGDIIGYVLEAGSFSGGANLLNMRTSSTSFTSLNTPAGTFYIRVRAVATCGVSAPSGEVTVTVPAP